MQLWSGIERIITPSNAVGGGTPKAWGRAYATKSRSFDSLTHISTVEMKRASRAKPAPFASLSPLHCMEGGGIP